MKHISVHEKHTKIFSVLKATPKQLNRAQKAQNDPKKSKSQQTKIKLSVYISKPQQYLQALKETRKS